MFGLLDDLDRRDVKDWLNSAVDDTADFYNTVTEYNYSNMWDDLGDYFRGLLSDEPDRPMPYSQVQMGQWSQGAGGPTPDPVRPMSPAAAWQKRVVELLKERDALWSQMPRPDTGSQDMRMNYSRDYPEYVKMLDLSPSPHAATARLMDGRYPYNFNRIPTSEYRPSTGDEDMSRDYRPAYFDAFQRITSPAGTPQTMRWHMEASGPEDPAARLKRMRDQEAVRLAKDQAREQLRLSREQAREQMNRPIF